MKTCIIEGIRGKPAEIYCLKAGQRYPRDKKATPKISSYGRIAFYQKGVIMWQWILGVVADVLDIIYEFAEAYLESDRREGNGNGTNTGKG